MMCIYSLCSKGFTMLLDTSNQDHTLDARELSMTHRYQFTLLWTSRDTIMVCLTNLSCNRFSQSLRRTISMSFHVKLLQISNYFSKFVTS